MQNKAPREHSAEPCSALDGTREDEAAIIYIA